jgi:hypothetical protein
VPKDAAGAPWQRLYFFPLSQGQGSFLLTLRCLIHDHIFSITILEVRIPTISAT